MRWLLTAAALLLSIVVVWYYLMGTPQYSLYRLAAALHAHDAEAAARFVDVDRIAQAASETMAGDYLEHEPRAAQALEALGQGGAKATAARALKPMVAARVRGEMAKMAREGGSMQGALALPAGLGAAFWRASVVREAPDAWVTFKDSDRTQARFRMSQQADRSWRITEFDPDWIRRQIRQR